MQTRDASAPGTADPGAGGGIRPDLISSVVIEVNDLGAARAFYGAIFRDAGGTWEGGDKGLRYLAGDQTIELVKRRFPRTLGHTGQHQAYGVARERLLPLTEELQAAGHEISWWSDDLPEEREPTAYVKDPSGNQVQIVSSSTNDLLLDHVALAVDDLEYAELFYQDALGGHLAYYHGFRTDNVLDVRAWSAGDDACAPWTRQAKYAVHGNRVEAGPVLQLLVEYGRSRLALILTSKRISEPPQERVKGTPLLALRIKESAERVVAHIDSLAGSRVSWRYRGRQMPYRREGQRVFLRDASGHFVRLDCG